MATVKLNDTVLSQGMNQGIDPAVLPLPQLAYVQNARMRKGGRWGKRYGTTVLPKVNRTGNVLGNGDGLIRTVGPGFSVVDDQCAVYDSSTSTWVDPKTLVPVNASQSWVENGHVPGTISGWIPDTAFFPVPAKSDQNQTSGACATAYAFGCLWTAIQFKDPVNGSDQMIRVVATDANQVVVCEQDFRASVANQGGVIYPKLVVCGTTLVLVYGSRLATGGANASIAARAATTVSGFGTAVATVFGVVANCIFDAIPHSTTDFLLGWQGASSNIQVATVDSTTLATVLGTSFGDLLSYPTIKSITLACAGSGQLVYCTYGAFNVTGTLNATRVRVIAANLGSTLGTATVSTSNSWTSYSTPLPGGGVRTIFGYTLNAANEPLFFFQDVTSTGTLVGTAVGAQWRMQPISRPVTINNQVYVWCTDTNAIPTFGYAHLLRIPAITEFLGTFAAGTKAVSCPVEIAAQDYLIASGPPSVDPMGFPAITQLGTSATYAAAMPVLLSVASSSTIFSREFRVVQAKHYTDSPAYRAVSPITVNNVNLLPGGVLSRIDQRGCVEAGFFLVPNLSLSSKGSGGFMTASSAYNYKCLYRSRNANGLFELSGDSVPLTVTMGASDTQTSLNIQTLEVSARENCILEIYRTLSNGSIYYLVAVIDGGLNNLSNGMTSYADNAADTSIRDNPVIYTQVSNQIPNAAPPPCRFGTVGGQRVFLGGLLRGEIAHASKFMIGDQSPTWCDSDQFRVVFPGKLTGLGWMDNLVGFTTEGIYVVSGDGPDDSGLGEFSPPVRMPYALGCIEPRSVITVDEGTFFQSARGLYLLPRGFGSPIPAGDVVMDVLAQYPIIVGAVYVNKPTEQTIRWSCVDTPTGANGVQIVYDIAHKVWSVDVISVVVPQTTIAQWFGNEVIMAGPSTSFANFCSTSSGFGDIGPAAVQMLLRTGDIRPFNLVGHGIVEKVGLMAELRSACSLSTVVTTANGAGTTTHAFTGSAPDTVGSMVYTEINLNKQTMRDVNSFRLEFSEVSQLEGLAIQGFTLQNEEQTQGFALLKVGNRVT